MKTKKGIMIGLCVGFIACMSMLPLGVIAEENNSVESESYASGQYKVGSDIPAGEYILLADDGRGYFCVSSDANGSEIIENENFDYNSIITVSDGQFFELERCYAVPFDAVDSLDLSETGMFKVGTHIAAGEYKLIADDDLMGYYCIYSDSGSRDIVANDNFDNSVYVSIEDGQYILLDRCYIENAVYVSETEQSDTEITTSDYLVEALTEEDFVVSGDSASEEFSQYGYNVYNYLQNVYGEETYSYFLYIEGVDESKEGVIETARNIVIGSTLDEVLNAYGYGKEYSFTDEEHVYSNIVELGDSIDAQIISSQCTTYISYNYEDKGQIVFYFDDNKEVSWIVFSNYIYAENYYNESATIVEVQEALNVAGYECGTADGIAGSKTKAAIEQYQIDKGLKVTGCIDGVLLNSLNSGSETEASAVEETEAETEASTDNTKEFADIMDTLPTLPISATIQVGDIIEESGMFACAVQYENRSIFYVMCNPDNDGKTTIGIIPNSLDSAQDAWDMWCFMLQAVDSSLSGYEAYGYALKAYQDGECEHNGIQYSFLEDSASFYIEY